MKKEVNHNIRKCFNEIIYKHRQIYGDYLICGDTGRYRSGRDQHDTRHHQNIPVGYGY